MKFGVFLLQYCTPETQFSLFDDLFDQLALMEKYGYYSAFIGERHQYPEGFFEPVSTITAFAARSEKLKIGSDVLLLPLYDPVRLAEMIATIDVMSKGRIILGVGLGYRREELETFGVSLKNRVSRFEEAVTLLHRFWTEDGVSFRGKNFAYSNVTVSPKPFQKPHPPILVGGEAESAIRRAAKIGDGWTSSSASTILMLKNHLEIYRKALKEYGKDWSDVQVAVLREAYIAKDYESARRIVEPHLVRLYMKYAAWENPHVVKPEQVIFDQLEERFVVGGPDECMEKVEAYRKLGIEHLSLRFQFPGMSQEDALSSIKLWGEKVIPYFEEK